VNDHTQDVFVRIVDIIDFEDYLNDRTNAIHANATYWRNYSLTNFYTDIEVGVAGQTAISDRINDLTQQYDTFVDDFEQVPAETLSFPTEEDTAIAAKKAAYNTAYDTYTAAAATETLAETAKLAADEAFSDASDEVDNANDIHNSALARLTEMTNAYNAMNTFNGYAQTFAEAVAAFIHEYDTVPGSGVDAQRNTLESALNIFTGERTPFTTATNEANAIGITNHQDLTALIQTSLVGPADGAKTTAEADLKSTTQALAEAETALQVAYNSLETAYNEVKDICPTWTPDSGKEFPPTP